MKNLPVRLKEKYEFKYEQAIAAINSVPENKKAHRRATTDHFRGVVLSSSSFP